jgi:hypothetical protein
MSSKSRPPTVLEYLIEQDFAPQSEGAWFDRDTGQGTIIRVVCDAAAETQLISLTPRCVCRYTIVFSPGAPDAVIIAALKATLLDATQPASRPMPGPASAQQAGPARRRRREREDETRGKTRREAVTPR